jgi:hypothetical protein
MMNMFIYYHLLTLSSRYTDRQQPVPTVTANGDSSAAHRQAKSLVFLRHASRINIDVRGNTINCTEALNQWTDGTGCYAEIVDSGVRHDFMKVKITSQFNRGFTFVVYAYE